MRSLLAEGGEEPRLDAWLRWQSQLDEDERWPSRYVATLGDEVVATASWRHRTIRRGPLEESIAELADVAIAARVDMPGLADQLIEAGLLDAAASGIDVAVDWRENRHAMHRPRGWERVGECYRYIRPARPSVALGGDIGTGLDHVVSNGLECVDRLHRALGAMCRTLDPRPIDVTSTAGIPASTMTTLYRERLPEGLHVVRDEPFFERLAGDPRRTHRTYVAWRYGEPVLGVIISTQAHDTNTISYLADLLPRPNATDPGVLHTLLGIALDEHADTSMITGTATLLSHDRFGSHGFLSAKRWPLARVLPPRTVFVHAMGRQPNWSEPEWSLTDADFV